MLRKSLRNTLAASAIAAGLIVSPGEARADLVVHYSLDGGATIINLLHSADPAGPSGEIDFNIGDVFQVDLLNVSSNSPGTASAAELIAASLHFKNTSDASASIVITISATGFVQPAAPPPMILGSRINGTVAVPSAANQLSFASCILANVNADSCAGAIAAAGPSAPVVTAGSFMDGVSTDIASLDAPYSLLEVLSLTLGAGADIGFQGTTTIAPVGTVPEPLSLALLGTGLIGLHLARRRTPERRPSRRLFPASSSIPRFIRVHQGFRFSVLRRLLSVSWGHAGSLRSTSSAIS